MEHRRDRRYAHRLRVELRVGQEIVSVQSRNLSLGGVFIELGRALPIDTAVHLRISFDDSAEAFDASGHVRWCETQAGRVVGVGVRFDGLQGREAMRLRSFLESQ